uniref:MedDCM-OCT-S30-C79-cds22 n=1 Tax=Candidatus Actinomarina minuta TaxID=1389454 RepID=S5DJX3_9ACTN|nr:MedDCM-OCT-S30-C79-cds22 [Candidatus Actinomarina minuta]|tara:strand:+ start:2296 stop:3615 length:1320 start_codon:yes stop_codon:yes gene_type:complete
MKNFNTLNPTDIFSLPNNWNKFKFYNLSSVIKEISKKIENEDVLSLTQNGIVVKNVESNKGQIAGSYEKYTKVTPNDIVFNPMDLISGWVDIVTQSGVVSPSYLSFRLDENKANPLFILFQFQTLYVNRMLFNFGKGVATHDGFGRWTINEDTILKTNIYLPDLETQNRAIKYLQQKTKNIDTLVKKIQEKIELLKEQQTTLVNQFVTKGLDSSVEMKDSGVEWIGEIPKHWKLKKLKYISKVSLSSVDRHEYDDELKVNICHYTDVYKNEYISNETQLQKGTCSESEFQKFSLVDKDILLTKDSESPDDIGIPTFVKGTFENTVCGYHIAIVRIFSDQIYSEYIYRLIQSKSSKDYFFTHSSGITRFGLGKGSIENLVIPIPPLNEQIEIAKYIELISSKSTSISKKLLKKISLLKDYRQSLISSVVTGKVKITKDMA